MGLNINPGTIVLFRGQFRTEYGKFVWFNTTTGECLIKKRNNQVCSVYRNDVSTLRQIDPEYKARLEQDFGSVEVVLPENPMQYKRDVEEKLKGVLDLSGRKIRVLANMALALKIL